MRRSNSSTAGSCRRSAAVTPYRLVRARSGGCCLDAAGATARAGRHPVEREDHHRRRALLDRAGRRHPRRSHRRGRNRCGNRAAGHTGHTPDRPARSSGHSRADRQPHAPDACRHHLAVGGAVGRRRVASRCARKAARTGQDRRSRRMDLQPRRMGDRAVRRRSASVHARGTRQGRHRTIPCCCRRRTTRRISIAARCRRSASTTRRPPNDWIVRDSAGPSRPAGSPKPASAGWSAKLPEAPPAAVEASTLGMIKDLNRAGLTSFGVAGCDADLDRLVSSNGRAEDKLNVRTYCINGVGVGNSAGAGRARASAHRRDEAVPGRQLRR